MNQTRSLLTAMFLVFLLCLLCASSLSAQQDIKNADLPAAVRKVADEQSRGAKFKAHQETWGDGQVNYYIEFKENGRAKGTLLNPQGNILLVAVELSLDSLPEAVRQKFQQEIQKTTDEHGKGVTFKIYRKDIRSRKPEEYEVELIKKDYSKSVVAGPQGNILEIDESTSLDSLPSAVRQGLLQAAGKGTISAIDSITKHDTIVAYSAEVIAAGKHSEVQVGPDGKLLDHRE